jgi:hypothetical protein
MPPRRQRFPPAVLFVSDLSYSDEEAAEAETLEEVSHIMGGVFTFVELASCGDGIKRPVYQRDSGDSVYELRFYMDETNCTCGKCEKDEMRWEITDLLMPVENGPIRMSSSASNARSPTSTSLDWRFTINGLKGFNDESLKCVAYSVQEVLPPLPPAAPAIAPEPAAEGGGGESKSKKKKRNKKKGRARSGRRGGEEEEEGEGGGGEEEEWSEDEGDLVETLTRMLQQFEGGDGHATFPGGAAALVSAAKALAEDEFDVELLATACAPADLVNEDGDGDGDGDGGGGGLSSDVAARAIAAAQSWQEAKRERARQRRQEQQWRTQHLERQRQVQQERDKREQLEQEKKHERDKQEQLERQVQQVREERKQLEQEKKQLERERQKEEQQQQQQREERRQEDEDNEEEGQETEDAAAPWPLEDLEMSLRAYLATLDLVSRRDTTLKAIREEMESVLGMDLGHMKEVIKNLTVKIYKEMAEDAKERLCAHCGVVGAKKRCGNCSTRYCSRLCCLAHWKNGHREECKKERSDKSKNAKKEKEKKKSTQKSAKP